MNEQCQPCHIVIGGVEEQYLLDYREHKVCGWCQASWLKREKLAGREISWLEFTTGKLKTETQRQLDDLRAMRAASGIPDGTYLRRSLMDKQGNPYQADFNEEPEESIWEWNLAEKVLDKVKQHEQKIRCPKCEGSGTVMRLGILMDCPDCGATGEVKQKRLDKPKLKENFLSDLRLLEEHKTSPEWIATKYLYEIPKEDSEIADNMKDYWKHQRCRAE